MLIRDYQLQSAMEITAQQHSEAMTQTRAMVHPGQSQVFRQIQSQARRDDGSRKQEVADESKSPSLDGSVSDSSLCPDIHVRSLMDLEDKRWLVLY